MIINTFLFDEIFVITLFHDSAMFHYDNFIGVMNSRKTVSNDQRGSPLKEFFQGLLNDYLGLGVDVSGSFVED